jgi:hypothetical protein
VVIRRPCRSSILMRRLLRYIETSETSPFLRPYELISNPRLKPVRYTPHSTAKEFATESRNSLAISSHPRDLQIRFSRFKLPPKPYDPQLSTHLESRKAIEPQQQHNVPSTIDAPKHPTLCVPAALSSNPHTLPTPIREHRRVCFQRCRGQCFQP